MLGLIGISCSLWNSEALNKEQWNYSNILASIFAFFTLTVNENLPKSLRERIQV